MFKFAKQKKQKQTKTKTNCLYIFGIKIKIEKFILIDFMKFRCFIKVYASLTKKVRSSQKEKA